MPFACPTNRFRRVVLAICLGLLVMPMLSATEAAGLDNTESDRIPVPGSAGAIQIPISITQSGTVSIGLYSADGQLIRPLAQLLELEQGEYDYYWDGMDLWGNILPAETELQVKIIHNPGLQAFYEMSVDVHGGHTPWPGKIGEGEDMRAGGWLADHSAPNTAAVVGNRVFFGSSLAEHGNNIVGCNLNGDKMWGGGIAGWTGPSFMCSNGSAAIVATKTGSLFHIDPTEFRKRTISTTRNGKPRALAAHGDKVFVYAVNHRKLRSPFRTAGVSLDFQQCIPQVKYSPPPTEFHMSNYAAINSVFNNGGRSGVGMRLLVTDTYAYFVAVFKEPKTVGTIVFDRAGGKKFDVHYLPADIEFDYDEHKPDDLLPEELPDDWQFFGETEFKRRVDWMVAKDEPVQARALFLRLFPHDKLLKQKRPLPSIWKPGFKMARVMARRIEALDLVPELTFNDKVVHSKPEKRLTPANGKAVAWDLKEQYPISEVRPSRVILDYKQPQTFRGVMLLDHVSCKTVLEKWIGPSDRTPANGEDNEEYWEYVSHLRSPFNRKLRYAAAVVGGHERYFLLPKAIETRAIRLTARTGRLRAKHGAGMNREEPFRNTCAEIFLVKPLDHVPEEDDQDNSQILEVHQFAFTDDSRGKAQVDITEKLAMGAIQAMTVGPDGTLYSIVDNYLCRSTEGADRLSHERIYGKNFDHPLSLACNERYLLVGERGVGIHVFDLKGQYLHKIGTGERSKGAWDPRSITNPRGLAIDANDKVWIAEPSFSPKRCAKFDIKGSCEREFFGPPMYGGGGHLDPDLKHFYYRGCEYELDWESGTSKLIAKNDELRHPNSPTMTQSSFGWTSLSQVRWVDDRRYIVGTGGGWIVTIKDGPTWKPAAVMGPAHRSPFLLTKPALKQHFSKIDLSDKSYIWVDHNEDGTYQIDEVDLFTHAEIGLEKSPFGGGKILKDLTFYKPHVRITPSRYLPSGVPVYERSALKRVRYGETPVYGRGVALGGKTSAKPTVGFHSVAVGPSSGLALREGQPYVLKPEGGYVGGEPQIKQTNFQPYILGQRMSQPMGWVGAEATSSEIGDIAVANGNTGIWDVVSIEHGLLVGRIFSGKTGGWGGLPNERGMEVTGKKYRQETFFGDFIQAKNGKYYTVGGKGFHAISRIENLDKFTITTSTVKVPADSIEPNTQLREWLRKRGDNDGRDVGPRSVTAERLDKRTKRFLQDGHLDDWGGPGRMQPLGPLRDENFFDVASDDKGLYIAYSGWANQGNASIDPRFLFKTGFSFEMKYDAKKGDPRRLVFGKHDGEWIAMMYIYNDESVAEEDKVLFASPLVVTKIAHVFQLPPNQAIVKFQKHDLNASLDDIESAQEGAAAGGLAGAIAKVLVVPEKYRADHGSKSKFSAEVFVSWKALGFQAKPGGFKADFGILSADTAGDVVEYRTQWSNSKTGHVSDLGIEAQINPRSWGSVKVPR